MIGNAPVVTAFILGLVTAVSPCTLAATISGAAFISRSMKTPRYTLLVGILLSIGRIITFFVIGGIMIYAGHTIGSLALFSQNVGSILLGIVLLICGVLFLDLITVNIDIGGGLIAKVMARIHSFGLLGAVFLGILFGLAFCPYSAALFFGMLIPLAVQVSEGYILPVLFGIGVNVPVLLFTGMVYIGSSKARLTMQRISHSWIYVSRILGVILISASLYYLGPYLTLKTGVPLDWLPYVVGCILLGGLVVSSIKKARKT
jgi:cytochrome c-type biogenesis protein